MATDVNLQIINSMTEEMLTSLKDSDGKIPSLANQLVMTDDEDVNLSQMRMSVLWTNPNSTSAFSAQTITLNSSDYDYLLFISDLYQSSSVSAQRNTVSMAIKGRGCSLNVSADYGGAEATFYRTATYINDTQYNISGGSYRSNTTTGNDNSILVPIQVIGLKKQPAMIYTGAELHEGNGISIEDGVISANVYPVGAIYLSVNATSPANLFGGSWTQLSAGYALWTATSGAGETISAGLPNITGQTTGQGYYQGGAFTSAGAITEQTTWGNYKWNKQDFKASNGETKLDGTIRNDVYGKSDTVQPPAIKVYAWKRIG